MPTGADTEGYTWISIDDFRAGIWSQPQGVGPAPPGAAQEAGTVGCYATSSGALTPLPSKVGFVPAPSGIYTNGTVYMVGMWVLAPTVFGSLGSGDEVVFAAMYNDGAGNIKQWIQSFYNQGSGWATTIYFNSQTGQGQGYFSATGGFTMVNSSNSTEAGQPCLALSFPYGATTGSAYMILYPDPTSNTDQTPYAWASPLPGRCHTHQNRVVMFEQTRYNWEGTVGGQPTVFFSNERISYTDPPNSLSTFTSGGVPQRSVFVQEHPVGYGAWGSFSAGELFVVKNSGGGAVISGDLNFPTVTAIPGVTSTAGIESRPSATQLGLMYMSRNNGVWAWGGDSASQKVSTQIADQSFVIDGYPIDLIEGPYFQAFQWNQWIMCSSQTSLLYDTVNNSWWRLSTFPYVGFDVSAYSGQLYCQRDHVSPTSVTAADVYDSSVPNTTYSWQSYPMATSVERFVNIRRAAVRAQGIGTVEVIITNEVGGTATGTLSFDSLTHPSIQMCDFGLQAQDLTLTLISTGSSGNPAPTIYSASTGYNEQQMASPL